MRNKKLLRVFVFYSLPRPAARSSPATKHEPEPLGIRVTVAEPGGMRTDWAGSSMKVDEVQPDYQATIGAFAAQIRSQADGAQSDPVKIAQAIAAMTHSDAPPLRLLLGSDAVFLGDLAAKSRAREDAKWRAVSLSTDADGTQAFGDTPIGRYVAGQMG